MIGKKKNIDQKATGISKKANELIKKEVVIR